MLKSNLSNFTELIQWTYLLYFIVLNGTYIFLSLIALVVLPRYIQKQSTHKLPHSQTGFEPPISLIVPAYNEAPVIIPTVEALLQVDYPEFEIIVVNDGSTDNMLEVLTERFSLEEFPAAIRNSIDHEPINNIYQSRTHPNIRVVDKAHGGSKADASNAGINCAQYSLFMQLDADTVLERDCMKLLVQPYLLNSTTVAVGGSVKILNGCKVKNGHLEEIGFPKNWWARFQVLEYSRAFLNSRVGWNTLDSLPVISGAFGLFKKEAVVTVGGYSRTSFGEDMDLVLRLHRHFRLNRKKYRIDFVTDATCWTEAPDSYAVLRKQRIRWQRGLFDCIWENRKLLFHPRSRGVGWGSMPYLIFVEALSPIIELFGIFLLIISAFLGLLSPEHSLIFLLLALSCGFLQSIFSILLEEIAFQSYPNRRAVYFMMWTAILENFGYRQINAFWRLVATIHWLFNKNKKWGSMIRTANWNESEDNIQVTKEKEVLNNNTTPETSGELVKETQ